MGFNSQRGDTVNVVNAAFTETKLDADIPLWKDPDNVSMAKSLLKNLIVFGLAFYLVFGVLRPLLRDLVKPPERSPRQAGATDEGEPGGTPGAPPEVAYTDTLTKVKEFSKANPKVTADIVKEWMGKE
jgi:flagellar M-ring protein FliF